MEPVRIHRDERFKEFVIAPEGEVGSIDRRGGAGAGIEIVMAISIANFHQDHVPRASDPFYQRGSCSARLGINHGGRRGPFLDARNWLSAGVAEA